jgi:transposase-like protein
MVAANTRDKPMKYDNETSLKLIDRYSNQGASVAELALEFDVPERSIIAKLSSLGVYKKKEYLNKQGEPPVKKEIYIERIAQLLKVNVELLESLEKVNKNVLKLLEDALTT